MFSPDEKYIPALKMRTWIKKDIHGYICEPSVRKDGMEYKCGWGISEKEAIEHCKQRNAPVAQLVEHSTDNRVVGGSSPSRCTIL
jgi:hypothetical protein